MLALLKRDLILAVRAGGGFGLAVAFFLIVCMLVPFGVGPSAEALRPIAPGILWVGALLSCLLSLDRIFALDYEDGSLDLLATAPVPLEGFVVIKALAHWLTTGLPLVIVAPLFGVLLHMDFDAIPWLIASLLIGTPALSVLGAFGAAISVGVRRGGFLLSLLVLPLYIPTLLLGTEIIRLGMTGNPFTLMLFQGGLTMGVIALIPIASAAALRVNLR